MQNLSDCNRIRLIAKLVAIGCLASMLLSYKLWLGDRHFPTTPVISFLTTSNHPYDYILPGLSIVSLLGILLLRNPRVYIGVFLLSAFLLGMQDLNRWQPWFYQYFWSFFLLIFFDFRCEDKKQMDTLLTTFKVIVASVYFWSGLQKLNPHFLSDTYPWLMEPFGQYFGSDFLKHVEFLGKAFPLLESCTGIFLLIKPLQRMAWWGIVAMHCFILFSLGPLGHDYNQVVWPWNLLMIALSFLLFYPETGIRGISFRSIFHYKSTSIAVIFLTFLPLFNFFNRWDSYLSHNLYSGNTSNGVIYVSDSLKKNLPPIIQKYALGEFGQNQINIKYWCMEELGVPAYPEERNFRKVTDYIQQFSTESDRPYLLYTDKLKAGEK